MTKGSLHYLPSEIPGSEEVSSSNKYVSRCANLKCAFDYMVEVTQHLILFSCVFDVITPIMTT